MLREWRAAMDWTQPFAAEQLGVGLRTYKAWELAECEPEHPLMLRLAMRAIEERLEARENITNR